MRSKHLLLLTVEGDYGLKSVLKLHQHFRALSIPIAWRLLIHSAVIPITLLDDLKERIADYASYQRLEISQKTRLWQHFMASHGWHDEEYLLFDGQTPAPFEQLMLGMPMPLFEFMQDAFEYHISATGENLLLYREHDIKAQVLIQLFSTWKDVQYRFAMSYSSLFVKGGNTILCKEILLIGRNQLLPEEELAFLHAYAEKLKPFGVSYRHMLFIGDDKNNALWQQTPLYHLDLFLLRCYSTAKKQEILIVAEIVFAQSAPPEAAQIMLALDREEVRLKEAIASQQLSIEVIRVPMIFYCDNSYFSFCNALCLDDESSASLHFPAYDYIETLGDEIKQAYSFFKQAASNKLEEEGIIHYFTQSDYSWMMKYRNASMHCHIKCLSFV